MDQNDFVIVENHLGQTIGNADYDASLDEHAKELLADKTILAELIQRHRNIKLHRRIRPRIPVMLLQHRTRRIDITAAHSVIGRAAANRAAR